MKYIKKIEINDSDLFEDLSIEFSDKMNCIMGGRGTGKTTIMNFIWSCLREDFETKKQDYELLRANLGSGKISIWIETEDGSEYRLDKTLGDIPLVHEMPMNKPVSFNSIEHYFKCDFYPAAKIESIGMSAIDRLELIDKKIQDEVVVQKNRINQIQIELDSNANEILAINNKVTSANELINHFKDVEEEFKLHQAKKVTGIDETEKTKFEEADKNEKLRKDEKRIFNKWFEFHSSMSNSLLKYKNFILEFNKNNQINTDAYTNKAQIENVKNIIDSGIEKYVNDIQELMDSIQLDNKQIEESYNQISDIHDLQQSEFVKLKQKFAKNREYINIYNSLSKKVNEKKNLEKDQQETSSKKQNFIDERRSLISKLNEAKEQLYNLRLNSIQELNESFEGEINISLHYGGITNHYENAIRESLKGSGLRYNELIPKIIDNFSPDEFASIVLSKNSEELKNISGIDEVRSKSIIEALVDSESIYRIEKIHCEDLPIFNLKIQGETTSENNYKRTENLSMGQRCTTVLPIVFSVSDNPLIIDQPEDNLDNRFIASKIHQIIKDQKQKRQLIFITHNPNIPVLSDSEFNVFLRYDRKSTILKSGSISDVKLQILGLLEGGEDAFKRRSDIYSSEIE